MSRSLVTLLLAAACFFAGGCFSAEFDPGVRVRTPRVKVR